MIRTSEIKAYFDRCLGFFCFWVLPSFVSNSKVEVRLFFFALIEILDSTTASSILPLSILLVKFLFFLGPDIGIQIYLPPGQRRKKNPSDLTFLFSGALHFIASNNDSGVREYDMERYQQYKHFRFDWPVNVSTFFFTFPNFWLL